MPQVCATPALMDLKRNPPATGVGFVRDVTVLSPSWPNWLLPQQYASPVELSAHTWKLPTLIEVNTGAVSKECGCGDTPTPSTAPQQSAFPAVESPHENTSPVPTDWNATPPSTSVGASRLSCVPSPSWP